MTTITPKSKLLFVINNGSGNNTIDYSGIIDQYFADKPDFDIEKIHLEQEIDCDALERSIQSAKADKVIAVGGDGTIKLLAGLLLNTPMPLGIIPAGSANGMAKDLNIPLEPNEALELICNGQAKQIHLIRINGQLCIHLSDIGFNAYVVKVFDSMQKRGMLSYVKAAWKVLWKHAKMKAVFKINDQTVEREAVMIVLANGSSYGTGVTINPEGKLDDELFEVIIIRKISLTEIFKMSFTRLPFNVKKTELFQTQAISIQSRKKVHFQIDGEYLGKVNTIEASIVPHAIYIIC